MQLSGTVKQVLPLEAGTSKSSGKDWQKQTFIISFKDGSYDKDLSITAMNDKTSLVPKVGQNVTVDFNVSSREYQNRWYTDCQLWKCTVNGQQSSVPAPLNEQDGDLPF